MATLRSIQFFLVLCIASTSLSGALQCFKSDKTKETCSFWQNYCQTAKEEQKIFGATIEATQRGCVRSCTPGVTKIKGFPVTISCCRGNLCNAPDFSDKLCYVCSSINGGGCDEEGIDPYSPNVIVTTCKGQCMSEVVKMGTTQIVARGCIEGCTNIPNMHANGNMVDINCCKTDKCNKGSVMSHPAIPNMNSHDTPANRNFPVGYHPYARPSHDKYHKKEPKQHGLHPDDDNKFAHHARNPNDGENRDDHKEEQKKDNVSSGLKLATCNLFIMISMTAYYFI